MAEAVPAMARSKSASGKNNRGRFAAQFERYAFQISGGRLDDEFPNLGRTGESHLVHIRMFGECGARGFAKSGNDVDHAVGNACFLDQFAKAQGSERSLLGGLEHDRASRRQRRRQLPRRHHEREIPGDDLADHADRLPQRIGVPITGAGNRDGLTVQSRRPSRHVAEHGDRSLHVAAARIGYGFAVVESLQFCELVLMLFQKVAEPPDELRSLGRRDPRPRPGFESPACRGDCQVDIGLVARRHVGDRFFRRRILDRKGLTALRGYPLSINQEFMFFVHELRRRRTESRFLDRNGHTILLAGMPDFVFPVKQYYIEIELVATTRRWG